MKTLNLILKGVYIFLGWYFTADTVRDFISEVTQYFKEKKTKESETGSELSETDSELSETDSKTTEKTQKTTKK